MAGMPHDFNFMSVSIPLLVFVGFILVLISRQSSARFMIDTRLYRQMHPPTERETSSSSVSGVHEEKSNSEGKAYNEFDWVDWPTDRFLYLLPATIMGFEI